MNDHPNKVLLSNPYGDASYDEFRKLGHAFVDKSSMIMELESRDTPRHPVLLRPRRFGKSTFVQMLKCFYDISYADRYDEIFSGTDVYAANLASHNTFHVLNFNFSGVSGDDKQTLIGDFVSAIVRGLSNFQKRYPDFALNLAELEKKTPSGIMKSFLRAYKLRYSKKSLYIMIDEYDSFASSLLSQDLKLFNAITGAGGFLKDFYAAIKEGAETCVAKTFITGVSSVSLDSLTSGFNIALNITSYKRFNEYAGFTEEELAQLIPNLVDTEKLGVGVDEIIYRMKPVYDGYCFSIQAERTVYNSSMCLYYLGRLRELEMFLPCEKTLDPASDHDSSKLGQLFALAKEGLADEIIETYLNGDRFEIDSFAENINLNQSAKYDRRQLLSVLFYLGYLTIDPEESDSEMLALKIPNIFMSKMFAKCVADMRLTSRSEFSDASLDASALLDARDDISSFAESCTEFLSSILTSHVLTNMSEMALNIALYSKLSFIRGLNVEMQKPLRIVGDGEKFADLVITVNRKRADERIYLIELKYLAKGQATDERIEKLATDGAKQALKYRSAIDFRDKTVRAYVMVFVGPACALWRMLE